jgi:hypothetical protein
MPKERKVVKVKVVRIKGKDEIVETLKVGLSRLEYKVVYDEEKDEDEGVVYRYEVLHAMGYADTVYIAVRCDHSECWVEAPIYRFLVEPCYCKPTPAEVVKCVKTVANNTKKIESLAEELQSIAQELAQYGFEVNKVLGGAEAYWSKAGEGTRSYIRVHLSPRASILQLQVEAEPTRIIGIARVLTKLVG